MHRDDRIVEVALLRIWKLICCAEPSELAPASTTSAAGNMGVSSIRNERCGGGRFVFTTGRIKLRHEAYAIGGSLPVFFQDARDIGSWPQDWGFSV